MNPLSIMPGLKGLILPFSDAAGRMSSSLGFPPPLRAQLCKKREHVTRWGDVHG